MQMTVRRISDEETPSADICIPRRKTHLNALHTVIISYLLYLNTTYRLLLRLCLIYTQPAFAAIMAQPEALANLIASAPYLI